MPSNYYDIDAILAEEELITCTTLFDFSYLSHLDPDMVDDKQHYLSENSRIKVPLWAVEKWANLGFVRLSLPRHYARKARERLEADPSEVDLRKRNERFFISGRKIVDLIEQSSQKVAKAIAKQGRKSRRNSQILALEQVAKEAVELRKSLLSTYTGERLRQTLDWALSSVGDDVTAYTNRLTEMERRLFHAGATAAAGHDCWKLYGNRRVLPKNSSSKQSTATQYSATTDNANENETEEQRDAKRRRTD